MFQKSGKLTHQLREGKVVELPFFPGFFRHSSGVGFLNHQQSFKGGLCLREWLVPGHGYFEHGSPLVGTVFFWCFSPIINPLIDSYCWWFRNPANQLISSISLFIVFYTSQVVVWDFFHQRCMFFNVWRCAMIHGWFDLVVAVRGKALEETMKFSSTSQVSPDPS